MERAPPAVERVFEGTRNAMLIADDSRRYTLANPAACALLETPRERLLAMTIDDFTPTEMRDRLEDLWQAFMEAGTQAGRYPLQLPSGRQLDVEYSATANIAPGQHLSVFMNPSLGPHGESAPADDRAGKLTPREREIVSLVALGVTTQEMAERLIISPETVSTHVKNSIDKLGARNRAHAVVLAIRSDQIDVLDL